MGERESEREKEREVDREREREREGEREKERERERERDRKRDILKSSVPFDNKQRMIQCSLTRRQEYQLCPTVASLDIRCWSS